MTTTPTASRFVAEHLLAPGDETTSLEAGQPLRLAASRCATCDRHVFPAMASCPVCGRRMEMVALAPTSRLRGHTSVLAPPPDVVLPVPYHVATAAFPEGVVVLGLLLAPPDDVPVGTALETVAHPVGDELTFAFRPVATPEGS